MTDKGAGKEGYVRPLPPESEGRAPGRGRLAGRHILVVGGGQRVLDAASDPVGNGRAMSLLFAREGAEVAVADMNLPSAEETVSQIVGEGGKAHAIEADISKPADITAMIAEAETALGTLDGLVLNVGIGVGGLGLEGATPDDWDKVLAVNLRGPMLCCKVALPRLADGSPVVFISSIAGLIAGSRLPAYDASKAALGGLMRHVALEGSRRGIRGAGPCRHTARTSRNARPPLARAHARSFRAAGDGLGNRLCGAFSRVGRKRLCDGADDRRR